MTPVAGFFGKIPTRGDFVRAGLPSDVVSALDGWWQRVIPGSRAILGAARWREAWMQAPVWRFALPAGCCGEAALLGLWVPSTDSAGRLFPLTLALSGAWTGGLDRAGGFLDAAEAAALHVLADDVAPDALAAAVAGAAGAAPLAVEPPGGGRWWTRGSPLVAATRLHLPGLPDEGRFAAMLCDGVTG